MSRNSTVSFVPESKLNYTVAGITLVDVLGTGTYASVYKGVMGNKLFAVKVLSKKGQNPAQLSILRQEAKIQKLLKHPNIVLLHKTIEEEDFMYLILECGDDDLYELIERESYFTTNIVNKLMISLLQGVSYMHSKGIAHRDVKPENLLIMQGCKLKLGDFGLATRDQLCEPGTGSQPYMPPEAFQDEAVDPKAGDVWSLGIVLINFRFRTTPWQKAVMEDPQFAAYVNDPTSLRRRFGLSEKFYTFIRRVLSVDPLKRISSSEMTKEIMHIEEYTKDVLDNFGQDSDWDTYENTDEEEPNYIKRSRSDDSGLGESFDPKEIAKIELAKRLEELNLT